MRLFGFSLAAAMIVLLTAGQAPAHFGMAVPAEPAATEENRTIDMTFSFSHPFAGQGMVLEKPAACAVVYEGEKTDLLADLEETKVMGYKAWTVDYRPKRPGVHTFYMEPQPYWEPAEDCHIIHYTKVSVPAFGGDEGWAEPAGLRTEIVPMLRPFGNYAGNTFVGKVLLNGEPVPNAEVEVELYNKGRFDMPLEYHETQVVTADENGVFSFACPQEGWWGFAALNTAEETIADPNGEQKPVELGAVFWTYMHGWDSK
jgi:cobalt/nickel transport protein